MADNNQLLAFDAIAVEINETQRKILFAQYSYKTKLYIINKLNSESERIEKENGKMSDNLDNMKQRIQLSQNNLNSLHSAVLSVESMNCSLKAVLIQKQLRKTKLKQSMDACLKKYREKWEEDKIVYESTPLVKEKLRIMREVENLKFQCRRLRIDKTHSADVFKSWIKIAKKQTQYAITQFAVHITVWPGKMEELVTRKECLHQLIFQVNALTQKKIAILAELDEIRVNRALYRINKKQITSKHMKFDGICLNFDDDLPNLAKFSECFKSELLLLQVPRKVERKPARIYEFGKYMPVSRNKPYELEENNNYLLQETNKTTVLEASNELNETSDFGKKCEKQVVEQFKQNQKITVLQDIILKPKITLKKDEGHSSSIETNKLTQINEAINYSNDADDVIAISSEEGKAVIQQPTFAIDGVNDDDSGLIVPPTQYRLTSDLKPSFATDGGNDDDSGLIVPPTQYRLTSDLKGESMSCSRDFNATNVPIFDADLPRPRSLDLQSGESQIMSEDSSLDCSNYLETPAFLLLSPKGGDQMNLHNTDTNQLTASSFLFGADKTKRGSFKMFGEESSQNEGGDAFSFLFNSPDAKKKKSSFFNLFE